MKENNIKKSDSYNKHLAKWFIVLIAIFPLGFVADFMAGRLTNNIFSIYFQMLLSNCINIGGGIIWFIGALIIQGKFLFSKGKRKSASICLIILIILCGWICKSAGDGYVYKNIVSFIKDLPYASSQTYCERTEKLNKIYKEISTGRGRYVTIFVETENGKYQVLDNIANEESYEEFEGRLENCGNVEMKYLPNSNLLLAIEPLEE